ncbi:MBL fold metallo-hydrolase [Candidatus Dojkabacteria bacterium]|uniref:MBL fold metallo-hydrolase n=1 Tax=Candidatus Dojkabacteria bacterium TaxID=2099670 RepID=A0A847VCR4_9BACT|nr:MBL fold metallo-hydrolase [Candidatus Dojkabacteria bacterium]
MKLKFCGGVRTVTGSCYYLDTGSYKLLVECGAFQGKDDVERLNYEPFPFNPSEIDAVILTHAHYDHCGRLPVLVKQGFKGKIISTQPTRDLTKIILLDAARLQKEEYSRWESRSKAEKPKKESSEEGALFMEKRPLFLEEDVQPVIDLFDVYPYGSSVHLSKDVEFRLRDAGHILGSSIVELWIKTAEGRERKIVFSGDLGQPGIRIVRDPDLIREADYVVCESTYGNRLHKSKDETILEFLSILKQAQEQNGNVLIPAFAIGRSQEVLYEINLFVENKILENLPVYLDSPMAKEATNIYKQYPTFYDEDARRLLEKGDDPFQFPGLVFVNSAEESKRLISKQGIVIIAGSGMCTGGRIVHHIKNNIEKENTHMIFVGYQVDGTLGRRIVDRTPEVKIMGKQYSVRAQIHTLGGFSAHGDQRDLRYWLRSFGHTPKKIFMVHGDEEISIGFGTNIQSELKVEVDIPKLNEEVELK